MIVLGSDVMNNKDGRPHRSILPKIAHQAMLDRGLVPEFSLRAIADLRGWHLGRSMFLAIHISCRILWLSAALSGRQSIEKQY